MNGAAPARRPRLELGPGLTYLPGYLDAAAQSELQLTSIAFASGFIAPRRETVEVVAPGPGASANAAVDERLRAESTAWLTSSDGTARFITKLRLQPESGGFSYVDDTIPGQLTYPTASYMKMAAGLRREKFGGASAKNRQTSLMSMLCSPLLASFGFSWRTPLLGKVE